MEREFDWESIMRAVSEFEEDADKRHGMAALEHIVPLLGELMESPREGVRKAVSAYEEALDEAYTREGKNRRGLIQAVANGPFETIPRALYNTVGVAYPSFKREDKDYALGQLLSIMDKLNYADVNGSRGEGHTPGIREPLLLSDIGITRPLYWPGMRKQERKIGECRDFSEFRDRFMTADGLFKSWEIESDFLMAYSVLRSDFSDFGEEYCEAAEESFLDRTVRGIVALRFAPRSIDSVSEEEIEERRERLRFLLPSPLHPQIDEYRDGQWASWEEFNPRDAAFQRMKKEEERED